VPGWHGTALARRSDHQTAAETVPARQDRAAAYKIGSGVQHRAPHYPLSVRGRAVLLPSLARPYLARKVHRHTYAPSSNLRMQALGRSGTPPLPCQSTTTGCLPAAFGCQNTATG